MSIEITHIRLTNGSRAHWLPFDKKVKDMEAMEVLRAFNRKQYKVNAVDFVYTIK